ncbi:MAG TPA: MobA/MobL family protein [Steroidobacteraceae bacterium]
MAIYYLGVKSFGRSAGTGGSVSTSAAAYRSGERIRDERMDRTYDHSHRRDVEYKEILLPSHLDAAGSQLDWARDRSRLWNAVERSEPRANARVAREYVLALPHELNAEQRTTLARTFAQEISDRYSNVVDLAIHQPRTDPRNFHAHLLSTTREVTASGLGPKTIAELTGSQRFELGLPRAMQEHAQLRERWADMANDALRDAGLEVRISHIPNSETILRPEARAWLPRVAWEIERRGEHSVLGERAREQFAQRREAAHAPLTTAPVLKTPGSSPEEVRKRAIEEWRAIRGQLGHAEPERAATSDLERQMGSLRRELGRDDFAL